MKKRFFVYIFLWVVLLINFVFAEELMLPTTTDVVKEEALKEQVKCVFVNSDSVQKCYTDDGKFGCSGAGTCISDVYGEKGDKLTWKSSCEGGSATVLDGDNEYAEFKCNEAPQTAIVNEQVKCVFINSGSEQNCYTDDGRFSCSGIGTCVTDVSGEKGKKLIWKSSCEGYAYTIVEGENEYAEFKCMYTQKPTEVKGPLGEVKEQVKCVFGNSNDKQECYTDDSRFRCSGIGTCEVGVYGKKGDKLIWKSSCGGYAYTVTEGNQESAEFKCVPESEVTEEQISGKGFRYAYWECYDGTGQKQGSQDSCQSSETWQKYAKEYCENRCYGDGSKCGVNSMGVSDECYLDFGKKDVVFIQTAEEAKVAEKKEEILICKDSCPLEGKCYPFGYRKDERFCSDSGSFIEQLKDDSVCENNFECSSNLCIDDRCVESGLIQKIMKFLKGIFQNDDVAPVNPI